MDLQQGADVKALRACINDLIGIVALPAIWSGGEASHIAGTLLDVLLDMVELEVAYIRLLEVGQAPVELARVAGGPQPPTRAMEIGRALDRALGEDSRRWPTADQITWEGRPLALAVMQLGLQGDVGVLVAGALREGFPTTIDRLLLSVAANQGVIGIQEARLMRQQKQVADDLDRRIAHRTRELAAANEELRREIVERRLMEERLRKEEAELKRSEALLAEAQRLSSTGSWYWRVSENTVEFSEQTCAIYEIDAGLTVTLEMIASRVHPEDLPILQRMIAIARGPATDLDYLYRAQMPDLTVKYLHLVARPSRDKEGRLEYIGAIHDITQRHRSDEALARVRAELARVTRTTTLGVLTASIAHEVNQPLSGIVTNASACLRMLAADPPNIEGASDTARRMIRDGNRAADVIARLRALFARKVAVAEPVDLNVATQEVVALSLSELHANRVAVSLDLAGDLPSVVGDRVQLQQVILNLVRNASDAMQQVEDRPRQMVIRTRREEGDTVTLSVRDAGVGLDPQSRDSLFEAFYSTKSDGMGIGLSVSRSIIESHHGRLRADPNDGPGTTVSFSIPIRGPVSPPS